MQQVSKLLEALALQQQHKTDKSVMYIVVCYIMHRCFCMIGAACHNEIRPNAPMIVRVLCTTTPQ